MPGVSEKEKWRERCDQAEGSTVTVLVHTSREKPGKIVESAMRCQGDHRASVYYRDESDN